MTCLRESVLDTIDTVAYLGFSKTYRTVFTQHCYAFLPRFDPMGVFCNVKPVAEPRGLTAAANVVGKAGVLPNRLLLVVQDAPKPPAILPHFITLIQT